ncbi:MAG: helix-turn-helix domain-containing protein [Phototrophicaceae bacterium]
MAERPYYHFSVLDENCPSRELLTLIADKWTALVIEVLMCGEMRYTELKQQVAGISDKMLSQTLHKLVEKQIVERRVYPTVPPQVEYQLTESGQSLSEPLHALVVWAERNQALLMNVHSQHDAKTNEKA